MTLESVRARLAGADAQRLLDGGDEDLAVADLAGMGGLLDGLDGALDLGVVDHDLDLHLGQEAHQVLGAAIDLGLALLAAETLDLADRQPRDADAGQRVPHFGELDRLDDGRHEFHAQSSSLSGLWSPKRLVAKRRAAHWQKKPSWKTRRAQPKTAGPRQKKARRKTRRAGGTAATRSSGRGNRRRGAARTCAR